MATSSTSLWQPDRPWISAGRILVLIALSPILLCGVLLGAAISALSFLFPPRPSSAQDMVDALTEILTVSDDVWALEDALSIAVGRKYSDPRIEALRLRVKRLPELPWHQDTIDELAAMRESAKAVAEESHS
jgi:hypothetical protein